MPAKNTDGKKLVAEVMTRNEYDVGTIGRRIFDLSRKGTVNVFFVMSRDHATHIIQPDNAIRHVLSMCLYGKYPMMRLYQEKRGTQVMQEADRIARETVRNACAYVMYEITLHIIDAVQTAPWLIPAILRKLHEVNIIKIALPLPKFADILRYFSLSLDEFRQLENIERRFFEIYGKDIVAVTIALNKIKEITDKNTAIEKESTRPNLSDMLPTIIANAERLLDEMANQTPEYIPDDEWYCEDNAPEKEARPQVQEPEQEFDIADLPFLGIENDGTCSPEFPEEQCDSVQPVAPVVVVEKELSHGQKLVGYRVGSKVKYIVMATDFDPSRAPQVYSMMLRKELELGKNFTTDRITRMIETRELLDAGFSMREIATYMKLSYSSVCRDKLDLERELEFA